MNLKKKLSNAPIWVLAIYATVVIFLLYTCCYAFRKPFTVGLYADQSLWGIDLKLFFVLSEIIGYALSKVIGTYILPGMKKNQRVFYLMAMLGFSEIAWMGFGALPTPFKVLSVFFSGLPLGMVWGVAFSFIEGRRISEVINVGLSAATIIASGLVKTLAQHLANEFSISEYWIPFATGAVVIPLVLILCYFLNQIPEPSERDIASRSERRSMAHGEKKWFFRKFFFGICMLLLFYGSLTVFRELRDSFAADIWKEYNITDALIFTKTEYPIAFVVLAMMVATVFIRNNKKALNLMYVISVLGGVVSIISTYAFSKGALDPVWWMTLSGLGLYMGYIPFTYLIERLFASLRLTCTAVFLIYMADSFGYVGTTGVFIFKNFTHIDFTWSNFLVYTSIIASVISIVSIILSYFYFNGKILKMKKTVEIAEPIDFK